MIVAGGSKETMHQGEDCDMPYAKRFQTFVNKLSDVVIDEFELYYIPRSPKEVGLGLPWKK